MNASTVTLDGLVGRRVKSLMDFSGIPRGTVGLVKSHYKDGPHEGVMVEWTTTSGTLLQDGFGRDDEFDETQWLEVL
ncbi:MAG: hypothetical protein V3W28_06240 [Thermoplasmata archaeon]